MPFHSIIHGAQHGPRHGPTRGSYWSTLPWPTEQVVAQEEPLTGAQLATMLGFGGEAIWKNLWLANESANPLYPSVGPHALDVLVGTPTFNVAGPTDAIDKAVSFTDGQAAQIGTANGAVNPGTNNWAFIAVIKFAAALPAANRIAFGVDATEDLFCQYMSGSGNVRTVTTDGGVGTQAAAVAADHSTDTWYVVMGTGVVGGNITCTSTLGDSGLVASTYVTLDCSTAGWALGRNGSAAPATIAMCAVAVGANATENTAIATLQTNRVTAVANLRTALGLS